MRMWSCVSIRAPALALLLSLAGGCATPWRPHGVALDGERVRLAVLPAQCSVPISKLADIQTVTNDVTASKSETSEQITRSIQVACDHVTTSIRAGLTNTYFFAVVPPQEVADAIATLAPTQSVIRLQTSQAIALGRTLHAPCLLTTEIAGYGRIKRSWMYLLVGSAAVEGIAQGVAAALVVDSVWVGVGLAAEEFLQEAVTWGGGVWLFDRIYTPVILESRLWSAADGTVLWKATTFVSIDRKALKQLPREERARKEVRLRVTADRAVRDMLHDLNKQAFKNVRDLRQPSPDVMATLPELTPSP
ncbi:MAG: hypothetical protein K8T26_07010 [Lentisphaerae bacterium]|nr:hypothetical protein [Lentisphaerota bacterium]